MIDFRWRRTPWHAILLGVMVTDFVSSFLAGRRYQRRKQVSKWRSKDPCVLYAIQERNQFLKSCAATIFSSCGVLVWDAEWSFCLDAEDEAVTQAQIQAAAPLSTAYRIEADSNQSLSPSLLPLDEKDLVSSLGLESSDSLREGALWIGEHHNAESDHNLITSLIQELYNVRRIRSKDGFPSMALGLEQVQVQFQNDLDDFIAGRISTDELREAVQWNTRWVWPFEVYKPVFEKSRELSIPLIALNVDSEDLAQVEKGGYPNLERSKLKKYIKDPKGFAEFSNHEDFREYVNYVIEPSYDLHERLGLLRNTISGQKLEENMTFRNFLSGRTLWDEGMASAAFQWNLAHPGGLLVGLVGADHVKFGKGIPGRYERMIETTKTSATSSSSPNALSSTSLILNPTLVDTRPSGSLLNVEGAGRSDIPETITLQLRYLKDGVDRNSPEERSRPENTGGVLSFSDYILIGDRFGRATSQS